MMGVLNAHINHVKTVSFKTQGLPEGNGDWGEKALLNVRETCKAFLFMTRRAC